LATQTFPLIITMFRINDMVSFAVENAIEEAFSDIPTVIFS
jgi:hypothetical protein